MESRLERKLYIAKHHHPRGTLLSSEGIILGRVKRRSNSQEMRKFRVGIYATNSFLPSLVKTVIYDSKSANHAKTANAHRATIQAG